MRFLGKPNGFFDLTNSDHSIGSYISIHDLSSIFDVSIEDLSAIDFIEFNKEFYVDERTAQLAWYNGKINNAPPIKINGTKCSLDELILKKIIINTYNDAIAAIPEGHITS